MAIDAKKKHLRCTLMGCERNYQVKILSKQRDVAKYTMSMPSNKEGSFSIKDTYQKKLTMAVGRIHKHSKDSQYRVDSKRGVTSYQRAF